jgi:hypothetical protein
MSTQYRIREFVLVTMATGALMASATQADTCVQPAVLNTTYADLGHMTATAPRLTGVAELGSMTVSAQRVSYPLVADLGAITVSAPRSADIQVAELGSLTVTAKRTSTILVATQSSDRSYE